MVFIVGSERHIVLVDGGKQIELVSQLNPTPDQARANITGLVLYTVNNMPVESGRFMTDEKPQKAAVCRLFVNLLVLDQSFVLMNRAL